MDSSFKHQILTCVNLCASAENQTKDSLNQAMVVFLFSFDETVPTAEVEPENADTYLHNFIHCTADTQLADIND